MRRMKAPCVSARRTRASVQRLRLSVTLALLCASCAMGIERFGVPIPSDSMARIQPGRSTRADILSLLGPPTWQSRSLAGPEDGETPVVAVRPGEEVLVWEYRERRETFGTALLYTYFSQRILTDALMVVLDANGLVSHVALGRQTNAGE